MSRNITAKPQSRYGGIGLPFSSKKTPGSYWNAADQEIQIAVSVHVRKGGPGRELSRARSFSQVHFFEAPVAKIPVESIAALQIAEIDIRPAIAIYIADRHSGAVMRH